MSGHEAVFDGMLSASAGRFCVTEQRLAELCRGTHPLKTAKGGRTNHGLRPESIHHHTREGHTCSRAKKVRKIPALAAEVVALHDLGPQGLKPWSL